MTKCDFSAIIYVNGTKWRTINNIRENRSFGALCVYLSRQGIKQATINIYYKGSFFRQAKWTIGDINLR